MTIELVGYDDQERVIEVEDKTKIIILNQMLGFVRKNGAADWVPLRAVHAIKP